MTTINEAAEALVRAYVARQAADQQEKDARETFRRLAADTGDNVVTLPDGEFAGARVTLSVGDRKSYDAEVLKALYDTGAVTKGAYYLVTKRDVVRDAFQEAVRTGRISPAVEDKVTVLSLVERVTVTVPKEK
jgi:hypothetical protein